MWKSNIRLNNVVISLILFILTFFLLISCQTSPSVIPPLSSVTAPAKNQLGIKSVPSSTTISIPTDTSWSNVTTINANPLWANIPGDNASWIWEIGKISWCPEWSGYAGQPSSSIWTYKRFEIPAGNIAEDSTAYIVADDSAQIYINGNFVEGDYGWWGQYGQLTLPACYFQTGQNKIELGAINGGGPGGIIARFDIKYRPSLMTVTANPAIITAGQTTLITVTPDFDCLWTLNILQKDGQLVMPYRPYSGTKTLTWNGKYWWGALVPNGEYTIKVASRGFEVTTTVTVGQLLNLTVSEDMISPKNQDGFKDTVNFTVEAGVNQNWQLSIDGINWTHTGTGNQAVSWDGKDNSGNFAGDGAYTVRLTSGTQTKTGTIKIDNTPPVVSDVMLVEENGTTTLKATIYDPEVNGVKSGLDQSSVSAVINLPGISPNIQYTLEGDNQVKISATLQKGFRITAEGQTNSITNLFANNPENNFIIAKDKLKNTSTNPLRLPNIKDSELLYDYTKKSDPCNTNDKMGLKLVYNFDIRQSSKDPSILGPDISLVFVQGNEPPFNDKNVIYYYTAIVPTDITVTTAETEAINLLQPLTEGTLNDAEFKLIQDEWSGWVYGLTVGGGEMPPAINTIHQKLPSYDNTLVVGVDFLNKGWQFIQKLKSQPNQTGILTINMNVRLMKKTKTVNFITGKEEWPEQTIDIYNNTYNLSLKLVKNKNNYYQVEVKSCAN